AASVDYSSGSQRYDLGVPHPDALVVEREVASLPDAVIDWRREAYSVLGSMLALCDPAVKLNAPATPARATRASWHNRSVERVVVELDGPRDVILVRSLRTSALVTMHASMGTRRDWIDEPLKCYPTPATHGGGARIVGECIGRHRYIEGSYCPLRWEPSPL